MSRYSVNVECHTLKGEFGSTFRIAKEGEVPKMLEIMGENLQFLE